MAHDSQHFDLPSELWFKTIAFVLSDSIYSVCCSTTADHLSWDRNAFGTLRLVSKSFSHTAVKVADLALAGRPGISGEEGNGDSEKLKLIYDRFKLINDIQSNQNARNFFFQSGVSLVSAYYGYIQLIKQCKALFSRSVHSDNATQQHHIVLMEKIHGLFPTAFKNILFMLDFMTVPEMVERLKRDVHRDWKFITSGLEIVYRCAQAVDRRDEWQSLDISTEFVDYVNDLYAVMKASAELYCSALKDRVPGEFPVISGLPGVEAAIKLIVSNGHHHQALASLVNSWAADTLRPVAPVVE